MSRPHDIGARPILPKEDALEFMVDLLCKEGVWVGAAELEAVLRKRWRALSAFAHAVHDAHNREAMVDQLSVKSQSKVAE